MSFVCRHKIKNPESQISRDLQSTRAQMRLVLSGTPIQNNLVERASFPIDFPRGRSAYCYLSNQYGHSSTSSSHRSSPKRRWRRSAPRST